MSYTTPQHFHPTTGTADQDDIVLACKHQARAAQIIHCRCCHYCCCWSSPCDSPFCVFCVCPCFDASYVSCASPSYVACSFYLLPDLQFRCRLTAAAPAVAEQVMKSSTHACSGRYGLSSLRGNMSVTLLSTREHVCCSCSSRA